MSKRKFPVAHLEPECNLTIPTTRRNAKLSENKINSNMNIEKSDLINNSKTKSKTEFQVKTENLIEMNNENINPKKSKLFETVLESNISTKLLQTNDQFQKNRIDIDYKSIFPEFIQRIYMNFVGTNFYCDSLKKKDEFYSGVGLYGIGIEEKMYKQRKKMEESLKRGFRLRPNPKPTKRFDGTIINRPRRLENGLPSKNIFYPTRPYIMRTKNRLNLFNIGRDSYRRKAKPAMRRNIKKKPSNTSNRPRFQLKPKSNSKDNNGGSNDESSSDIESNSIALTKPKRKLKMPQLEFKYCYETGTKAKKIVEMIKPSNNSNQFDMKDILEETEEEKIETESVEILKTDHCNDDGTFRDEIVEINTEEVHKIDSDSSSVVEVLPPTKALVVVQHELQNRDDLSENNPETSSDSLESSAKDSPDLHKEKMNSSLNNSSNLSMSANSSNKRKKPWRPKKALNLLDKLRLGLQCSVIQTETDIILQNLSTEDLGTLQSRIQGLTTFKNIEAEYDKSGQETARVTIDRKALNIPLKTYEGSLEGKNSGLKRYFDSLKKKVISKTVENLQIERKKPILSAKPLNLPSGACKNLDKSNNNNLGVSILSHNHHQNFDRKCIEDQNSSQNWQRSKCRSVKKVRKLYTQSTNTPNILLRSCHNPSNSNQQSIKSSNSSDQSINSINYHHSHSILPMSYQNFRMSTSGNTPIDSVASANLVQSSSTIPSNTVVSNLGQITNPCLTPQTLASVAFYPKLTKVPSLPTIPTNNTGSVPSLPSLITNTGSSSINITNTLSDNQIPDPEQSINNLVKPKNSSNFDMQQGTVQPSAQTKDKEICTSTTTSSVSHVSSNSITTHVSTPNNMIDMSSDPDATSLSKSTLLSVTMPTVTMSSSSANHATPATALSASQLLMMKKGNSTTSTQNNIDNQLNRSSSPKNYYHNQYQHGHAAHNSQNYPNFQSHHNYSNSAAFLQQITSNNHNSVTNPVHNVNSNDQLIANQILKPFKKLISNPNNNGSSSVPPAKIEIDDDDNETDFELPDHLTSGSITTPQIIKSQSTESQKTPDKQNEDKYCVAGTSETPTPNIIKPLIQQSASPSVQSPVSGKVTPINTTPIKSRHFQPIAHVLSPGKQMPVSATPTMIDPSTPTSSIKIKHRKLTHNFLSSSHTNFREVLCGASASTPAQHNIISRTQPSTIVQFQTQPIYKSVNTSTSVPASPSKSSSTVLKSLLVGTPTNNNANNNTSSSDPNNSNNQGSQNSNNIHHIANNNSCLIGPKPINNWAAKYLSNNTNLQQDNSKIKWQVSGSIKPTNYLDNKPGNKE